MFKKYALAFLCILSFTITHAQYNSLTITDPQRRSPTSQGYITNANIEITPEGAYARFDMTFTIAADMNKYNQSTALEAVLNFDLPKGAFFHDSWLWLNDSVIIRADVVERNRAIVIYENIVNRRRDPSLLIKTGENRYKLNVYPLRTDYPRKVKLSYSVPFNWREDVAQSIISTQIFKLSKNQPPVHININQNPLFNTPTFVNSDINKFVVGHNGSQIKLKLNSSDYIFQDPLLRYNTSLNSKPSVTVYPTNNNNGYYQMVIPPSAIKVGQSRYVSLIITNGGSSSNTIHSVSEIKTKVKNALLGNFGNIDSFTIFFEDGNVVQKTSNSWTAVTAKNVNDAISKIPLSLSNNSVSKYEELLIKAYQFCATKDPKNAQTILISNDTKYTFNQKTANELVDSIKSKAGGLNHKFNVINYSKYRSYSGGRSYNANDPLYSKLTLESKGLYHKYTQRTYVYLNGKYTYHYNLDVENAIQQISASLYTTSSYNIDLKLPSGFTYSEYNLNKTKKLSLSDNYVVFGKYSGSMPTTATVDIKVAQATQSINKSYAITNVPFGSKTYSKVWTHNYIEELISNNNQTLTQEIIDSSINQRVLCSFTAFLALETGDTINTNLDDNPNVTSITEEELLDETLKLYPNPFSESINIELPKNAQRLEIYDMTGRVIYIENISNKTKIKWNGRDNNDTIMPKGTYLIVVYTIDKKHAIKVIKQ